ncbi:hypothetical protein JKP88DRAFT_288942 [Tribonema minus]|uniref:AMP-dependent synthetase/ligase domain-containing protein n=1 Tax=Tribonema minus TaxID=303371 RepID=A0A835Z6I3_9STRA|nr:hypothetical protein JKP88DRAFT_288942 [Tribonema minus]
MARGALWWQGLSLPEVRWVVTDSLPAISDVGATAALGAPKPEDLAFLQYTSGSTSAPKGVMLTHANLAHNLAFITRAIGADEDTVELSWLPQYHDMGLIGAYLGCLYCGGRGFYLSPAAFIRRPALWPQLLSRHRVTHTQAPSFAFGLAARKYASLAQQQGDVPAAPRERLDLSRLKHVINAAEPVDPVSMDRFIAVFTPHGLPAGVIRPTYGLAEHTVCVCTNGARRLVAHRAALEGARSTAAARDTAAAVAATTSAAAAPQAAAAAVDAAAAQAAVAAQAAAAAAAAAAEAPRGVLRLVEKLELWAFDVDTSARGGGDEGVRVACLVGCGDVAEAAAHGVDVRVVGCAVADAAAATAAGMPAALPDGRVGEIWVRTPATALPDGRVGEIWVRSGSCAAGYWGLPEATEATFGLQLAGEGGRFMRTGDLGLIWEGQLHVTGREKDLVIIRGKNHYPQDLERTAEATEPGVLRLGCSAAFGAPAAGSSRLGGGAETLVLVAELTDAHAAMDTSAAEALCARVRGALAQQHGALCARVRGALAQQHGSAASTVCLIKPRSVCKTTSGKIARARCRAAFLDGALQARG